MRLSENIFDGVSLADDIRGAAVVLYGLSLVSFAGILPLTKGFQIFRLDLTLSIAQTNTLDVAENGLYESILPASSRRIARYVTRLRMLHSWSWAAEMYGCLRNTQVLNMATSASKRKSVL